MYNKLLNKIISLTIVSFAICTMFCNATNKQNKNNIKMSTVIKISVPATISGIIASKIYYSNYCKNIINPIQLDEQQIENSGSKFQGLPNVGNSCYLNATIQQLYRIDSFREAILNAEVSNIESKSDKSDKPYVHALKSIFSSIAAGNNITKSQMRFLVSELDHKNVQGDLIECIQKITENCAKELNTNSLEIQIPFENICIENNTDRIFENNSKYYQNDDNLIIFVPRIGKANEFPHIDMPYEKDIDGKGHFELSSVSAFNGSDNNGHYYTYQKKDDNSWVILNDSKVTKTNETDIHDSISQKGVLYIYKKLK